MRIKQLGTPGVAKNFAALFSSQQQWPAAAIIVGASIWGVIWYPLRLLDALGVSGIATAALIGVVACCFSLLAFRQALKETLRSILTQPVPKKSAYWLLPALGITAGISTVSILWAMIHGEVMRVLLLFYLSPVWTAFFAHWLLHEKITFIDIVAALCALTGAVLILWSPQLGLPLPSEPAEWAGLFSGVGFVLQNVLALKITRTLPVKKPQLRTVVVFAGDALVGSLLCAFESISGASSSLSVAQPGVALSLLLGLGVLLAANNVLIQYGLSRMAANRAALLMLFEIVVTAVSSWLLAGETLGWREISGGAAIVSASLLSSWLHRQQKGTAPPAVS